MNEFSRFDKIFGIDSSKKKKKSPATPAFKSRKRKSLPQSFVSSGTGRRFRFDSPIRENKPPVLESPDKCDILPHLSCNAEDFEKDLIFDSDDSTGDIKRETFTQRLNKSFHQDIYSPNIEECSESDDVFDLTPEIQRIVSVNSSILEILQRKSKYRAMNKVPTAGGLLEKLRAAKLSRSNDACEFIKSTSDKEPGTRKIEVIEFCEFRRHILLRFKFIDIFVVDENDHFLVLPLDFNQLLVKQLSYDLIFDVSAREFLPQHFLHFAKQIKAALPF